MHPLHLVNALCESAAAHCWRKGTLQSTGAAESQLPRPALQEGERKTPWRSLSASTQAEARWCTGEAGHAPSQICLRGGGGSGLSQQQLILLGTAPWPRAAVTGHAAPAPAPPGQEAPPEQGRGGASRARGGSGACAGSRADGGAARERSSHGPGPGAQRQGGVRVRIRRDSGAAGRQGRGVAGQGRLEPGSSASRLSPPTGAANPS